MSVIVLGIDNAAANAFIYLISKNRDNLYFSYERLEKYCIEVIRYLNDRNIKCIFEFSRQAQLNMIEKYPDVFEEVMIDNKPCVRLAKGATTEQLIVIGKCLDWNVLLAYESKGAVAILKGKE